MKMIKGAKNWDKKSFHYYQTNNPTDSILTKIFKKKYLETCGPTAAVMCLLAIDKDVKITCPGTYSIQTEEVLSDWFNDPKVAHLREAIRKGVDYIPGNRIPQFYPEAVKHVYGFHDAEFKWTKNIAGFLWSGHSVQLCLKKPGHFVTAVAYDDYSGDIIYHDPWPERKGLKNKGFKERLTIKEQKNNLQNYCIVYFDTEK